MTVYLWNCCHHCGEGTNEALNHTDSFDNICNECLDEIDMLEDRCPDCNSPFPGWHPAVQFEGEVEICTNGFHLKEHHTNKPEFMQAVRDKRLRMPPNA